jgi:hypothetical protein
VTGIVVNIADHAARPQRRQAARFPRTARQGAEVESGETAAGEPNRTTGLIAWRPSQTPGCSPAAATRDATYRKEAGATPSALPPSLVATIANCPTITADGRTLYLCLGGMAWRDEIGWRWTNQRAPMIHDIWNPALIAALDARATS